VCSIRGSVSQLKISGDHVFLGLRTERGTLIEGFYAAGSLAESYFGVRQLVNFTEIEAAI